MPTTQTMAPLANTDIQTAMQQLTGDWVAKSSNENFARSAKRAWLRNELCAFVLYRAIGNGGYDLEELIKLGELLLAQGPPDRGVRITPETHPGYSGQVAEPLPKDQDGGAWSGGDPGWD